MNGNTEKLVDEITVLQADYIKNAIKLADKYQIDRNEIVRNSATAFLAMAEFCDYSEMKLD